MIRALVTGAMLAVALVGCDTSPAFDAEGFRCDPGNGCPVGFACVDGFCRAGGSAGGGMGGGQGGGLGEDAGEDAGTDGGADVDGGSDGGLDGGDLCLGKSCGAPPASTCLDANTLRTYPATGTCNPSNGECEYAPTDSPCATGCDAGTCPGSLCATVTCNSPPAGGCTDAGTLVTWASSGTCDPSSGSCSYTSTPQGCAYGCLGNACLPAPYAFGQTMPKVRSAVTALDQGPGSNGDHALVVGPSGYAAKWNGSTWTRLDAGTSQNLLSVSLFTEGSGFGGYVGGASGTLLRYDGSALTPVTVPGLTASVASVHATSATTAIAGGGSQIALRGTAGWALETFGLGSVVNSVRGVFTEGGALRAAGRCTTGIATTTSGPCGISWTSAAGAPVMDVDTGTAAQEFVAVGPDADKSTTTYALLAVGEGTRRFSATSGTFDSTETVTVAEGSGVVAISRSETAASGAVYLLSQPDSAGFGALIRAVDSGAGPNAGKTKLLDVFNTGAIGRNDSGGILFSDSDSASATIGRRGASTNEWYDLGELWVSVEQGSSGLVLYSGFGDVASPGGATGVWRLARNPAAPVNAVINDGAGPGPGVMVGEGGRILRWSSFLNTVSALSSPTTQGLNALCRVSDTQYYAVGDNGTAIDISGGTPGTLSASVMTTPSTANLFDVVCRGAGDAFAVGDNGTVLRLSGSTWAAASPSLGSSANLRTAALVDGVLYVAGSTLFAKLEKGSWDVGLPAQTGLGRLFGRHARELYGISADKVVRFDGAAWTTAFTATSTLYGGAQTASRIVFVGAQGAVVEGQ